MTLHLDVLFDDAAVIGVPTARDETYSKMPGHSDDQGDHCSNAS